MVHRKLRYPRYQHKNCPSKRTHSGHNWLELKTAIYSICRGLENAPDITLMEFFDD